MALPAPFPESTFDPCAATTVISARTRTLFQLRLAEAVAERFAAVALPVLMTTTHSSSSHLPQKFETVFTRRLMMGHITA